MGMEDSQLICAYFDCLDGKPRLHHKLHESDWSYRRLEVSARSMCDGISVWVREMSRPQNERSPSVLAHEVARSERMADLFEGYVSGPLLQGELSMAHVILAVSLETARQRGPGDLTNTRPRLASWLRRMSDLPSLRATGLP
jgi:glutathione S-transferase